MYKRIFYIILSFWASYSVAQEQAVVKYFDIIIGISATSEEETYKAIKTLATEGDNGLNYLGYCTNQKCLILRARFNRYKDKDAVVLFLKQKAGDTVLGYKDYSIKEFYRQCDFDKESEYQYLKSNYK